MDNFYEGKKVLIAGGAGLCGQALIGKLDFAGADIVATQWRSRKIDPLMASLIEVVDNIDLRTAPVNQLKDLYSGKDIVFWAAAHVGGAKSIQDNASELIHYNLEMTARNIKAAVDSGVKRFTYISSSYAYPDLPHPAREEDVDIGDVPLVHYGLGWIKRYVETLCRHHHMTSGTKFALVRPTGIYGPHDSFNLETCHALPALIKKFIDGPLPVQVWGNGQEQRQWTYVDDLVDGLLAVTENYCVADAVNIASPEVHTVQDLVELIQAEIAPGRLLPPLLGYSASIENNYGFTGEGPQVIKDRLVDTSKAKRLLGFECKTSLKDGLQKTIDWYKANYDARPS